MRESGRLALLGQDAFAHRVDLRLATAGLVFVDPGPGLLPLAPHLDQPVQEAVGVRIEALGWKLAAQHIADVEAGQIHHRKGAHGKAKIVNHLVHVLRLGPLEDQQPGLADVPLEHAVADETVTDGRDHADLGYPFGQFDRRQKHLGMGLGGLDDLQQPHQIGRRKEMQAQNVARPVGLGGDGVGIQVAGVGGQDGAGPGHPVELAEDLLFEIHLLEDRLDDQIRLAEILVFRGAADQRQALLDLGFGQFAALDGTLVIGPHALLGRLDRLIRDLEHGDRDTGVGKGHRNAAAHGPTADHADRIDPPRFDHRVEMGDPADHMLGEKDVP